MFLNELRPNSGSKKRANRVGRGIGSGSGKTCNRGHKGQKSRSGGFNKVGFEGGQMPLHRRLPKFGFTSYLKTITTEIRLSDLEKISDNIITLDVLKKNKLVQHKIKRVKVINSGELTKQLTLSGIHATATAKEKIKSLGGKVEG